MKPKGVTNWLLPIVCATAFSPVYAMDRGPYAGGSISNSVVEDNTRANDVDIDVDSNSAGYKLFGGYAFNPNFAIEGGYTDFGSIEDDGTLNYVGELDGVNVTALAMAPVGPVDLFAKGGAFFWEQEYSVSSIEVQNDGVDPLLGIGVGGNIGKIGVRGEVEFYDIAGADKTSMLSLGVLYQF